ncbi:MAG TPA: 16S rRNA (cytidine(1402)-2'-O)-methyltransferase [Usitatibacteraceae bacterium]|nr:16S rRNA (cytidine(1402)-2'-O)-methyltransferase [Usitatibacteraceae bacterium]
MKESNNTAELYVVATPIGHLGDITLRALETLRTVDLIAAEDTRLTRGLLAHHGISTRLIAVHEHNERHAAEGIVKLLREGRRVALVSDAGTPGISDPGAIVVRAVRDAGFRIVPIPGPSALVAAMSAAGIESTAFTFAGFLPSAGKERRRALEALKSCSETLVVYESPHRIADCLDDMAGAFGDAAIVVIGRELTKTFETIVRMNLGEARAWVAADAHHQRGEFVVIVDRAAGRAAKDTSTGAPCGAISAEEQELERTLRVLCAELPLKQAVAIAVQLTGQKKNRVYDMALAIKGEAAP